jgi:ArsR family transcriptional regulator
MTNQVDLCKALWNEVRLDILRWLKDPETHLNKPTDHLAANLSDKGGICVGDIQEKANLSQSTVSQYLTSLQKVGLLESERHGKWTYYRRNEEKIQDLTACLKGEL